MSRIGSDIQVRVNCAVRAQSAKRINVRCYDSPMNEKGKVRSQVTGDCSEWIGIRVVTD